MSFSEQCSECQEQIELDEDGEMIGDCPMCNTLCPHTPYQSDDNYLPLDFNRE